MTWQAKAQILQIGRILSSLDSHHFQQGVGPYLRLVFPGLVESANLAVLDNSGIDYVLWSDNQQFPVAIQCKGFKVKDNEVNSDQVAQCNKSINSFLNSGFSVNKYILVLNRDVHDTKIRNDISHLLGEIVKSGKAETTEVWYRSVILRTIFETAKDHIRAFLKQQATVQSEQFSIETFPGYQPISDVPLRECVAVIGPNKLERIEKGDAIVADPSSLLFGDSKMRLSVLLGEFGFGKTTAVYRAIDQKLQNVYYVRGATIQGAFSNFADFIDKSVDIDDMMSDIPEEDFKILRPLFRIATCDLLRHDPTVPCVFVLDALDESLALTRTGGMQMLFRQLAHLEVPTVLTMRTEFWRDRLNDFKALYGNVMSTPGKVQKNKYVKLYELLNWDNEQIIALTERYSKSLQDDNQRKNVEKLITIFQTDGYESLYGDIPRRPLFLRFILDTVAIKGPYSATRVSLFNEWATAKIRRDIEEPARYGGTRLTIAGTHASIDQVVAIAYKAMEIAAMEMTQERDGRIELKPYCDLGAIKDKLGKSGTIIEETGLILNSLIVPVCSRHTGENLIVRFAHRAFQEYFLARCISSDAISLNGVIPNGVQDWLNAITNQKNSAHENDQVIF